MDDIRAKLRKVGLRLGPVSKLRAGKPQEKGRELSPAARKRIAAAQKKRWAEYRAKKAEQGDQEARLVATSA